MKGSIFAFIGIMWILMIIGGGIIVTLLGPISVTGYGDLNQIFSSGIQAVIAVILVIVWTPAFFKALRASIVLSTSCNRTLSVISSSRNFASMPAAEIAPKVSLTRPLSWNW